MKNLIVLVLFVFGVCFINSVYAEDGDAADKPKKEKKAKKPKKPAPQLEEMTLVGNITVTEKKNKKDPTKVNKRFTFTDEAGNKVNLPKPRKPKKPKKGKVADPAPPLILLEDYADSKVSITFMGFTKEKKGKQIPFIKKIIKIEKVAE